MRRELRRELRDLRNEVAEARKQVPKVPAIESRLRAEATISRVDTDKKLTKLQRELDRMRVNQSITDYKLSELRKEATASKAASIDVELQTSTSRLVMRDIHPAAAKALREFAAQVIDAADGGAVWWSDTAGTA
jgi:hypothetical protein